MDGNTLVFILSPDSTGRCDFRRKARPEWPPTGEVGRDSRNLRDLEAGVGQGISEFPVPNLNAQVSKLWQEREWLLRGRQRFSQLHDAIRRSIPEKLRR